MNEYGYCATAIVSEDYFRRRAVHDPILRQLYKALEDPRLKKNSEGRGMTSLKIDLSRPLPRFYSHEIEF